MQQTPSVEQKASLPTASTVVVIPNASPNNVIAGLAGAPDSTASNSKELEVVHATELTKEQWSKILCVETIWLRDSC